MFLWLFLSVVSVTWCHHHEYKKNHKPELKRDDDEEDNLPFSQKKFEMMLQKAIMKIIMGNLSSADEMLLKSFNYSHSDIQAVRERELNKQREEEKANFEAMEKWNQQKSMKKRKLKEQEELELFNKKALEDYENLEPVEEEKVPSEQTLHEKFDEAMKPHVIFQIRPDDSEFNSRSEETDDKLAKLFVEEKVEESNAATTLIKEPFLDSVDVVTPVPIPYLKMLEKDNSARDVYQVSESETKRINEIKFEELLFAV